jgi:hypothetical protein
LRKKSTVLTGSKFGGINRTPNKGFFWGKPYDSNRFERELVGNDSTMRSGRGRGRHTWKAGTWRWKGSEPVIVRGWGDFSFYLDIETAEAAATGYIGRR